MTLKKEVKDLTRSELLKLNSALKQACHEIVGKNKSVFVRTYNVNNLDHTAYYEYEDNSIRIFRGGIKNVNRYVEIFVHEWKHSLQKGLKRRYQKMTDQYGYWNNPYEVEAREAEKIFKSQVWKRTKELMK
jgi:UDP-N-acetylmuramate-alanine ligase